MRLRRSHVLPVIALLLVSLACSLPILPENQTPAAGNAQTQAAQTLAVLMTQAVSQPTTAAPVIGAAATLTPNVPAAPTFTLAPSVTQSGPTLTASPKPPACDQAAFVADINVPDGAEIPAGVQFSKSWQLRNTGTCTWTPEYAVVFEAGEAMGGPAAQKLGVSVAPNQTVDITIPLRAPGTVGSYRGNWKLRNAAGVLFGIGGQNEHFYVDIKVVAAPASSNGYNFANNYCLAEWTANDKTLSCVGKDGDAQGFVLFRSKPLLENDYVDDEPGLLTNPPKVNDSWIRGKFPSFTVQSGDRFRAILGCEASSKNCAVRFQLDYQVDNGALQTLAGWDEVYDQKYQPVEVDLSPLAGKNVRFILTVLSAGASDNDRALWFMPRIDR